MNSEKRLETTPRKLIYLLIVILSFTVIISLFLYEYQLNVNANEDSISYSFCNARNNVFWNFTGGYNSTGAINSIPINGYNSGNKTQDFNIVISFVNATISTAKNQPYILNNSTSAEFRMVLSSNESAREQVYFNIDRNVASYSIKLSVHGNQGYLKANPVYPTNVVFSYSHLFPNFFALTSADGVSLGYNY